MTLLDKLKTQEGNIARGAKEAANAGRATIDQAEAKLKAPGLLRDLGAAVYKERSGDGSAANTREIDRLVAEITSHKTRHESAPKTTNKKPTADSSPRTSPAKATGSSTTYTRSAKQTPKPARKAANAEHARAGMAPARAAATKRSPTTSKPSTSSAGTSTTPKTSTATTKPRSS